MAVNRLGPGHRAREIPRHFPAQHAADIDRVRCVVCWERRYLLVQHHVKRSENIGRWNLPGGRLKYLEKPRAGLRRELDEELGLRAKTLLLVGDWRDRWQIHRVFGCETPQAINGYNRKEIKSVGWFSLEEVIALARATRLRRGFELAAILEFERRRSA